MMQRHSSRRALRHCAFRQGLRVQYGSSGDLQLGEYGNDDTGEVIEYHVERTTPQRPDKLGQASRSSVSV